MRARPPQSATSRHYAEPIQANSGDYAGDSRSTIRDERHLDDAIQRLSLLQWLGDGEWTGHNQVEGPPTLSGPVESYASPEHRQMRMCNTSKSFCPLANFVAPPGTLAAVAAARRSKLSAGACAWAAG